jgi:hypothetical protein
VKHDWVAWFLLSLSATTAWATTLTIVDPEGRPAKGARVSSLVRPATHSLVEQLAGPVATETTNEKGIVELALPAISQDVFLLADHPGFLPFWSSLSSLAGSRVTLSAATRRGRVTAPSRAKLEGTACAEWRRTLPVVFHEVTFERCGALQASGDFAIPGVEPDASGTLSVKAKGFLTVSRPLDSLAPIVLTPGVEIRGLVTSSAGKAIANARVTSRAGQVVETAPSGRFSIACSLPETLVVRAPGFRALKVPVPVGAAPAKPLAVKLTPGPTLQGKVVTSTGELPPELALNLVRRSEGGWRAERLETDIHDGAFLIDLPGPGPFSLRISAAAYRSYESRIFTAASAEQVDLGVIRLTTGGGVEGRLMDAASGQSVPGALVSLLPLGTAGFQRLARQPTAQSVSDGQGRFRIVGQGEGSYELRVRRDGYAPISEELSLDEDAVLTRDIHLGRGAELHGWVRSRGGQPRPGLAVLFASRGGSSLAPVAEATTDEDGTFAHVHLGAGEYRVEVRAQTVLLTQQVVVPEGEEDVELPLTIPGTTVHGQVLRHEAPVAGGSLRIAPLGQTEPLMGKLILQTPSGTEIIGPPDAWQETEVAADGRFILAEAPTGPVLFVYTSPQQAVWRWTREIPPTEDAQVVLVFQSGQLHGRVVDAQTEEPVADARATAWDASGVLSGEATSDDRGAFAIEGLAEGVYHLEVVRSGYRRGVIDRAEVRREASRSFDLRLAPSEDAAIAIRLARPSGQPLAFAFVTLLSGRGELERSLSLDETGEIEYRDLRAGTYRVLWSDPSVGAGASEPLNLEGGKETAFDRQLEPPGQLDLHCGDASCAETSIDNLALLTATGFDLAPLLPGFSPRLRMSAGGHVTLGTLQPGRYLLRLRVAGSVLAQTLTIEPGATTIAPVAH